MPIAQDPAVTPQNGRTFTIASPSGIASAVSPGELAERTKAHDWKSCVGQLTVGSNPTLSAESCPQAVGGALRSGLRDDRATAPALA